MRQPTERQTLEPTAPSGNVVDLQDLLERVRVLETALRSVQHRLEGIEARGPEAAAASPREEFSPGVTPLSPLAVPSLELTDGQKSWLTSQAFPLWLELGLRCVLGSVPGVEHGRLAVEL